MIEMPEVLTYNPHWGIAACSIVTVALADLPLPLADTVIVPLLEDVEEFSETTTQQEPSSSSLLTVIHETLDV